MIYKFMSEDYLTTLVNIQTDGRFVHKSIDWQMYYWQIIDEVGG